MCDIDRKIVCIMKILSESPEEALGARVIARRLQDFGIELGERAVRYHLKLMDADGLSRCVGREGRFITEAGIEEMEKYAVRDKVSCVTTKIDQLAWQTDFDLDECSGTVPVDIACFPKNEFKRAMDAMKPVFKNGVSMSDRVVVARGGQSVGRFTIPHGKKALATISTSVVNSVFLKAGIHVEPKFCGILQFRNNRPIRFVELIPYTECSLNPAELFVRAKMTSVSQAAINGAGIILASFCEIPDYCWPKAQELQNRLRGNGLRGILLIGGPDESLFGITPAPNRVGMVLACGFNPMAAAAEAGIDEMESNTLSEMVDYQSLSRFSDIYR